MSICEQTERDKSLKTNTKRKYAICAEIEPALPRALTRRVKIEQFVKENFKIVKGLAPSAPAKSPESGEEMVDKQPLFFADDGRDENECFGSDHRWYAGDRWRHWSTVTRQMGNVIVAIMTTTG